MRRLIISTFFARAISAFLNFLIVLLIARHAGPAIKGEVTLLITTIWFFIFFSDIFGGQVLVYLIPRNKLELLVLPAYLWSAFVALLGYVLLKVLPITHAAHIPSIVVLSFLSSVTSIHQTILLSSKRITHSNLIQVLSLMVQVAGILFCFYFLRIHDTYAYIYASLAAYLLTASLSFFLVRDYIHISEFGKVFSLKDLQGPLRHGLQFQMVEILQLLNLRYYYYQLGLQQGSRYLGIYSVGISVLETIWLLSRSINTINYINTSQSTNTKQEVARTVSLVKISVLLSIVALIIIALIPASTYSLVFGPGFADVKYAVRFLFPGILIYCVPLVISSFYLGIARYNRLIVSYLAGSVTLIILGWLLIPKYVMSGAGLAASISFAVTALFVTGYFIYDNKVSLSAFTITGKDVKNYVSQGAKLLKEISSSISNKRNR